LNPRTHPGCGGVHEEADPEQVGLFLFPTSWSDEVLFQPILEDVAVTAREAAAYVSSDKKAKAKAMDDIARP
jgi:hypothetical protein